MQRVVVHRALGYERVEHANLVAGLHEHVADLGQRVVLGVGHDEVGVELHEVGLHVVASLARARAAYDAHVEVSVELDVALHAGEREARVLRQQKDVVRVGVVPRRVLPDAGDRRPPGASRLLALARALGVGHGEEHEREPRHAPRKQPAYLGGRQREVDSERRGEHRGAHRVPRGHHEVARFEQQRLGPVLGRRCRLPEVQAEPREDWRGKYREYEGCVHPSPMVVPMGSMLPTTGPRGRYLPKTESFGRVV